MTHNAIDFGFGWDPSVDFDLAQIETHVLPHVEEHALTQIQSKAGYLEMQQAIQNHDTQRLQQLVATHKEYLTPSRWKTLGRLAIKNFSPSIIEVLDQCKWDDVLSNDLTLWCITNDQEQAFDFAKRVFIQTDKNDKYAFAIKNVYNLLMGVTINNYVLFDKYRAKLVDVLDPAQKEVLAGQLVTSLISITPKSVVAFKNLFKELSTVDWERVFGAHPPFSHWRQFSHAFGLTVLLQQHPHIAPQLAKMQKAQTLKEKRLELIALNNIFKIGLHEPITPKMRGVDVFKPEFFEHLKSTKTTEVCMRRQNDIIIHQNGKKDVVSHTPYMLLNTYMFVKQFESFCKLKQIPWCDKMFSGVEQIIRNDTNSIEILAASPHGQNALRQLLEKPENASVVAQRVTRMDKKQLAAVLPCLPTTPNIGGLTFAHHIAVNMLSQTDAERTTNLINSPFIDWDAPSRDGFTAKDIVLSNVGDDARQQYEDAFQLRQMLLLKNATQQVRKDSGLKNKSQTKRKL